MHECNPLHYVLPADVIFKGISHFQRNESITNLLGFSQKYTVKRLCNGKLAQLFLKLFAISHFVIKKSDPKVHMYLPLLAV